jgi:hypothetical protein
MWLCAILNRTAATTSLAVRMELLISNRIDQLFAGTSTIAILLADGVLPESADPP